MAKVKKLVKDIRVFPAVLGRKTIPTNRLMDFICREKYGEGWQYDRMDGRHCYKMVEKEVDV